jgi:xylulokinase
VTGYPQAIPAVTIGASFGAAFFAAAAVQPVDIDEWNPIVDTTEPRPGPRATYDELYELYLALYPATADIAHRLAAHQHRTAR